MLSILRFFLATCVMMFHLSGKVGHLGVLSVNFFYVISGYLMTMVLHETYHFDAIRFFTNRFLRLYPMQYAICLLSLPFIWGLGNAYAFHSMWGTPHWQDWMSNLLIFTWLLPIEQHFRISPTTWSVAVEINCYLLLWLFVSRRQWTAAISVVAAIAWQVHQFCIGAADASHYFPVSAALLPFSLGASSYFLARSLPCTQRTAPRAIQVLALSAVIVAFLFNWHLSLRYDVSPFHGLFYYVNTAIACVSVIVLQGMRASGRLGRMAKWCGDLSYPVFLAQWVAGFIAWHLLGAGAMHTGWSVFALAFAIATAGSVLAVLLVDRPILRIRARIRSAASESPAEPVVSQLVSDKMLGD
jgi:peptidoglycan/LPS O-acetylase OafA/YrhL